MAKVAFVISHTDDPQMERHLTEILGKGGVNTYPEYIGMCQCGTKINANHKQVNCPDCGTQVLMGIGITFSAWSAGRL